MAGTALANFNDFMKVTGPRYLTSAEDVINEAVKNKIDIIYINIM